MKVWGIIATVLLVASLCLNVWYYTETKSLNANVKQQLEYSYYSEYQLPFTTMSELRSDIHQLVDENYRLEAENEEYRTILAQIRQEAERAQQYEMWEQFLQFIWSLALL